MNPVEKRLRALEAAAGAGKSNDMCAQIRRLQARGQEVPSVTVEVGEDVDEAIERAGIPSGAVCIVLILVPPNPKTEAPGAGFGLVAGP